MALTGPASGRQAAGGGCAVVPGGKRWWRPHVGQGHGTGMKGQTREVSRGKTVRPRRFPNRKGA